MMNVIITAPEDGVNIAPQTIDPMCAVFDGLTLGDIPLDAGVGFQMVFGAPAEGNNVDLQPFHVAMSTRVKIVETKDGRPMELGGRTRGSTRRTSGRSGSTG